MFLEAVGQPLTVRFRSDGQTVRLEPGRPVQLPEDRALKLLKQAAGQVRIVDPASGKPVLWEGMDGVIRVGLALLLGRTGNQYWVGIEHERGFSWVREDRLRPRKALPACGACGGRRFWASVRGAITCMTCHPPASPGVVRSVIEGTG
jgi:hypothetical protein